MRARRYAVLVGLLMIVGSLSAGMPIMAEEKIELRFWMHQNPAFMAANEEIIARFEKLHPNVTIKLESFDYNVFIQTLQTSMPAGTEGDIIEMFGSWVCSYANRLAEIPEDVMSYSDAQEQFLAAPLDGYYCNGQLFGLPSEFNIESGAALVNKALFEEAGLPYPPQWETTADLLSDAKALTKVDDGMMSVTGYHFVSQDGLLFELLAGILQRGGEYWKADYSGVNFTTPEAKATLKEMKSWVETGVIDPLLFNGTTNGVGDAFFSGQAAISFVGSWIIAVGLEQHPDVQFDYVNIPPYAGDTPLFAADAGWGKVVSPNSKHQDIAFEFIKFAAAEAANAKFWNERTGTIPALKAVADDPALLEAKPFFKASIDILEHGRNIGPFPDRDKVWYEIAYPHILAVLQDSETIDDALAAIEAETNATFAQ